MLPHSQVMLLHLRHQENNHLHLHRMVAPPQVHLVKVKLVVPRQLVTPTLTPLTGMY